MKKVTHLWKQRDGTKIRICDMSDSHLLNSIKMIERICQKVHNSEMMACASIVFNGEMAQEEQDKFLTNSTWEDYAPDSYEYLITEAARRGLLKDGGP